jgi:hypothetical protein
MHSEFHIRLGFRLSVSNKHQIITIICDTVLIYQIVQCDDIGNGSSVEPYSLVVTLHRCFSSYYHGATVALESHTLFRLDNLVYQGCIAEKIHIGLTAKEDNLLKIEFDQGACLVEKLSDYWLEFIVELRKLESLVHLKVLCFFSF